MCAFDAHLANYLSFKIFWAHCEVLGVNNKPGETHSKDSLGLEVAGTLKVVTENVKESVISI